MAFTTSQLVAARVSTLMSAAGMTAKDLADETGISYNTLRRRLTGNSAFTVSELDAVAATLDTSLADLVEAAA